VQTYITEKTLQPTSRVTRENGNLFAIQ